MVPLPFGEGGSRSMKDQESPFDWKAGGKHQRLWVQVKKWDYKLTSVTTRYFSRYFGFEGIVGRRPTSRFQVEVLGHVEVFEPSEESASREVGVFHYGDLAPGIKAGSVTLRVPRETYSELLRMFAVTFACNGVSGLGLELNLSDPRGAEPGFWDTGWIGQEISVAEFNLHSGGGLREPPLLERLFP